MGALGLVLPTSACRNASESLPDTQAVAAIAKSMPTVADGELYFSASEDGACHATDCPEAGARKGWVVDCSNLNTVVTAVEDDLISNGFASKDTGSDSADHGLFAGTVDGVALIGSVTDTTDASESSQPTEEPYASDPGRLAGRCAVFVGITAAS